MRFRKVLPVVAVFIFGTVTFAIGFVDDQILRQVNCNENTSNEDNRENIKNLYKKFTQKYTGRVTYFGDYPYGITTCMLDPLPPIQRSSGLFLAAVSSKEYMDSFACGSCIRLTPRNEALKRTMNISVGDLIKTYYATVVDICQHCKPGEMRLYKDGDGSHDVIYEAIPCKEITGTDGLLKMRFSTCSNDNKRMKVQIKNMKIPVAQMELYQDQKWSCLKRGKNNHYLLKNLQNATFPITGRVTSIDGQIFGFAFNDNDMKDGNEIFLPSQFSSFHLDKLDRLPHLKCYEGKNTFKNTSNSSSHSNSTSKSIDEDMSSVDALHNSSFATTAEQNIMSDFINSTTKKPADDKDNISDTIKQKSKANLCKGGSIKNGFLGNCDKYLTCQNGKATVRSCPKGFSYDKEKMKCDRGICLNGNLKKSSEEEDIYTKRFT